MMEDGRCKMEDGQELLNSKLNIGNKNNTHIFRKRALVKR